MKITVASMLLSLTVLFSAVALGAPLPPNAKDDNKVHVATCRDGAEMYAASNEHRGACSGHGGVRSWADGSPVKGKGRKTTYR